jgi:hypothetical protein
MTPSSSPPKPDAPAKVGVMMYLFFGLFAVIGAVVSVPLFFLPAWQTISAGDWVETPCTVLESSLESSRGSKGSTLYRVRIVYRYEFAGQEYTGDRYKFSSGSTNIGVDSMREAVSFHSVGSRRICWVNPLEPAESVINRDWNWELAIGLVPVVFLAVGVGGLAALFRGWNPNDKSASAGPATAKPERGPVTLTPAFSRGVLAVVLGVFALVWNGVVWTIASGVLRSWATDSPDICQTVFLLPFAGVGLLMAGLAILQFLSTFNPAPVVTLEPGTPSPGGMVTVTWSVPSGTERFRRLRVRLVCRKEVERGTGKDRKTERTVLAEHPVLDTDRPEEMRDGRGKVALPADALPSAAGGSHRIVWVVAVNGDIPRWPDVQDELPFTVLPAAEAADGRPSLEKA